MQMLGLVPSLSQSVANSTDLRNGHVGEQMGEQMCLNVPLKPGSE